VRHQQRRCDTVVRLAEGLTGDALDYGAGWGDLTDRLAPQFRRIVGVDADPVRSAYAAREFAPIEFRTCTATGTNFPDASFDVVFSTVVLHFVPSPAAYLAECRRLLRPGGHLVVLIQSPESMWMLARRLRRSAPQVQEWGGSTRAQFREFLEQSGFHPGREAGFYDPPFDRVETLGDIAISLMNTAGHALGIHGRWSYVGYCCRRMG
jgi:ubiquinone/menaquinone biosynthesis C-methylase UbiE